MRGASALDRLLAEFPGDPLRALVVWEPVIPTDVAPPMTGVLGLVRDSRAIQFWDPERVLSAEILRAVDAEPSRYGFERAFPPDEIVWDVVAVFGPGSRWDAGVPVPTFFGAPVQDAVAGAREAIARALESPEGDPLRGAP